MNVQLKNGSKESKQFLLQMIRDIVNCEKSWKIYSRVVKFTVKSFHNDSLNNIPDYLHYPEDIKTNIENMSKELYEYQMKINNKNICLMIIVDKYSEHKQQYVTEIIRLVYIWLSIAINRHNTLCSQTLNIYMFMTSSIKLIPSVNANELNRQHINSAFTYSCNKINDIHVFRKEEWFKVFIHETFHNLGFDFSSIDRRFSDRYAAKIFPISTDFRTYESYCETWATIIHSIFVCLQKNNKRKHSNMLSDISNIIEKEVMFSIFQCNKILHHFGMNYDDLYSQNTASQFARLHKYKENTPIISYFFFKTILLYNTNSFIDWCVQNNESPLMFSNPEKNDNNDYEKIKKYVTMIGSYHEETNFINDMKYVMKKYTEKISNISPNDVYYFHTLRMSLHDI